MFDLLRFARVARTVLGLVGGWSNPVFRTFALVLSCVGVGLAVGGATVLGLCVALVVYVAVWAVRDGFSILRGGSFPRSDGTHRS